MPLLKQLEELYTVESTEHEEPVERLSRSMSADFSPEPLDPHSTNAAQLKAAHLLVSAMEGKRHHICHNPLSSSISIL